MTPAKRVVVTGIGTVTPLGMDRETVWSALCASKSGISNIRNFDTSGFNSTLAGICQNFQPTAFFSEREAARLDRSSQFALIATELALKDAKLGNPEAYSDETGVILGTAYGSIEATEDGYAAFYGNGKRSAIAVPKAMCNAAAANVAIRFKFRGPNLTISTACSSGANAIGQSYHLIRHGVVERIITGGVDAPVTPAIMDHWQVLRVLSTKNDTPARACKPFSANRDGFVMAEGAGIVILETLERALERDAPIFGEIVGYASTADASHITLPDSDGEAQAIVNALQDACLTPQDIHYINAHGTGTKFNDVSETNAIKQVFGDYAYQVPVSSIKPMIGHSMGASGAVEFIATVLSVGSGAIPQTINYEEFDQQCDLDYVTEGPRTIEWHENRRTALTNSFGFGGNNAVLVVRQYVE
jgi:3-oxoacyl-[acyl-carrier-protein] synthase II